MSNLALKVENLSKQYRLGLIGTGTLSHDLNRWWHRIRGKEDPYLKVGEVNDRSAKGESQYVWALKDINFEVKHGEVLGIIGRNGAGKSTLLKILSNVTSPTSGKVTLWGRTASLLEVGTGFHPELTGRENIFLNGAILGMTKSEIKRKLDEIIDFSGCERYIDTPVKRYSSGMKVRLAFAVAAHLEPEILIVDEVLAVGDAEFQKKALGKMQEVSHGDGRTVLFVSHNMSSVRSLCDRGVLVQKGKIVLNDEISNVIENYEHQGNVKIRPIWINENKRDLNEPAFIKQIEILSTPNNRNLQFRNSEDIVIKTIIQVNEYNPGYKLGFDLIKNGTIIFRTHHIDSNIHTNSLPVGISTLFCTIPKELLTVGEYQLQPLLSIHCVKNLSHIDFPILKFNIILDTIYSDYHSILTDRNHPGVIFPILKWRLEYLKL